MMQVSRSSLCALCLFHCITHHIACSVALQNAIKSLWAAAWTPNAVAVCTCRDIHCESSYTVYGYPQWITGHSLALSGSVSGHGHTVHASAARLLPTARLCHTLQDAPI
jgi:hypothetical protein